MFGLETLFEIMHHAEQLSVLFEDGFARGLGAGLGSGNFKFLGIKLPYVWSVVKYNFPSNTWAIPHTPRAALAKMTSARIKRRLYDELVQARGIVQNIPKIRAMWVQVGKHSQQMCP